MPRNPSGVYSLPAGNPVVPGTLIETTWANPTMSDIGAALTGSLPRDGSAGMQGPLMLAFNGTRPLEAVTVQQLDSAVGGSANYSPAGTLQYFAFSQVPTGWLKADGAAVSRTTYANLFAAIGTIYGAGNGTTTFNLPDLRGQFLRCFDDGRGTDPSRVFGSVQQAANQQHNHNVTDPGHSHGVIDPGHTHTAPEGLFGTSATYFIPLEVAGSGLSSVTGNSKTGISVALASAGVTATAEGSEARPINTAIGICIRAFGALQTDGLGSMAFQNKNAVDITGGKGEFTTLSCATAPVNPTDVARLADIGGAIASVVSSNPQVLTVDNSDPKNLILRPLVNQPFGSVQLNASGQVPPNMIPLSDINYQGPWDASSGQNPTQAFPAVTFTDGDMYMIDVAGVINLRDNTGVEQPLMAAVGAEIIYVTGSPTLPLIGWYLNPAPTITGATAAQISFIPYGTITAVDVQDALQQTDDSKAPKNNPTFTGTVVGVTKAMVGLGNVANLAPADLPISTATQAALDGKQAAGSYQAADPQLSSLVRQNQQGASYTCVSTDSGKHIYMTASGAYLLPNNATVPFAIGTVITFFNGSGANCTIDIVSPDALYLAGGALVGVRTLASRGIVTAIKVANQAWAISGAGVT